MASHPSTATGAVAEFAAGRRRPHDRALALSALGIVFGDIGTSPIYAIRETFGDTGGLQRSEAAVLGVLSVITLALIVIVTVKYITIVLRADNNGEGGVLAISALAHRSARSAPQSALIVGLAIIVRPGRQAAR